MSIAAKIVAEVLRRAQKRMPKVIDARAHGALDYLQVAFFLAMALRWRKRDQRAAVAALLTGSVLLVEALFTDYPLGAVKVLPFAAHGRLDKILAGSSHRFPKIFGFENASQAAVFRGNTAFEVAVTGMTDYDSDRARWQSAA